MKLNLLKPQHVQKWELRAGMKNEANLNRNKRV